MDASKQSSESATAILKEWMGETKKKPKKESKTTTTTNQEAAAGDQETTASNQKEPEPKKKTKGKTEDEMTAAKTTIKRKLVTEPPSDFAPAPAVVDARVDLIKAQLISEVEDAVEKVRVEEQEKAAKVRKSDKKLVEADLELSDDGGVDNDYDDNFNEAKQCPNTEEHDLLGYEAQPQVINVQSPNVPLITVYVCSH